MSVASVAPDAFSANDLDLLQQISTQVAIAVENALAYQGIPAATMDALQGSFWPGNIRELQNVIERAVILSPGPELRVPLADLQVTSPREAADTSASIGQLRNAERELILRVRVE